MEFFGDAINKARDAFDTACKKTNDVVNLQKQKFDLASMESKLSKDFEAFGRVCYDFVAVGGEISNEAKALAEEITAKKKEIETARNEILKAQGKKFCTKCGAPNVTEAHFCYACGESFIKSDDAQ